jgi:hypothetical protein
VEGKSTTVGVDRFEETGRDGEGLKVDELLKLVPASKPVGNSMESTSGTADDGTSSTGGAYGEPSRLNSYCEYGYHFSLLRTIDGGEIGRFS